MALRSLIALKAEAKRRERMAILLSKKAEKVKSSCTCSAGTQWKISSLVPLVGLLEVPDSGAEYIVCAYFVCDACGQVRLYSLTHLGVTHEELEKAGFGELWTGE